jgi:hypothetical protein
MPPPRTARHAGAFDDARQVEAAAALHAEVAVHAAVQLKHVLAARHLVKPVDVLRDHRGKLPCALHFGKL